jgi:hypothetical protein
MLIIRAFDVDEMVRNLEIAALSQFEIPSFLSCAIGRAACSLLHTLSRLKPASMNLFAPESRVTRSAASSRFRCSHPRKAPRAREELL